MSELERARKEGAQEILEWLKDKLDNEWIIDELQTYIDDWETK